MDDEKSLGRFIRERRIELGLTQEELGDRLDPPLSQAAISAMEIRRIGLPPPTRIRQLAAALEVDPVTLLAESGWTGAAGEAVMASLDTKFEYPTARNRWEAELLELLPTLDTHSIRALLAVAKQMQPGGEA